jgi:hypothetical protein
MERSHRKLPISNWRRKRAQVEERKKAGKAVVRKEATRKINQQITMKMRC